MSSVTAWLIRFGYDALAGSPYSGFSGRRIVESTSEKSLWMSR